MAETPNSEPFLLNPRRPLRPRFQRQAHGEVVAEEGVLHQQVNTGWVYLKVYRLDRGSSKGLIRTVAVPVTVPVTLPLEIEWDGRDDLGNVMEAGVYGYDLVGWATEDGSATGDDGDKKTSDWLFIDVALDAQGNPILEVEYAGYDDNGTAEDETDDNHLYYIRRYKLREVAVPLDNDGDGWENEDPVDGVDNDGDGLVDEDPEDYQPLRGASEGKIALYDPDLQKVAEWSIPSLLCVEHNANDGLATSAEGLQHSVLVKVPIALMDKAGEYRFVISAKDSHADREKGHRQKWALERNQSARKPAYISDVDDGWLKVKLEPSGEIVSLPSYGLHYSRLPHCNRYREVGQPVRADH